jgi:hypothetical protein
MCTGFACLIGACAIHPQSGEAIKVTDEAVSGAQTTTFCELQKFPEKFKNKMIRVRALYETDFEESIITAPSCDTPFPTTWVSFDKQWESRTKRRVRHSISNLKWRVQTDVVFIGVFKADGHYGHMDMYTFSIEVYKVEAVRASGSFRPLPEQAATKH